MSISVLILTLNEEINLPACLAAVAWSDDIVVLDSFSTDRTVNWWIEKHNRYSWLDARESLRSLEGERVDWRGILDRGDAVRRRRTLKALSFRLPCRPLLRFFYMYFLRRGFLDGRPGYVYCRLLASYEFMIVVKMAEIRRRQQGLPI